MGVLGIDLGGSHIAIGVVSSGCVQASVNVETDGGSLERLLSNLTAAIRQCCSGAGVSPEDCAGIAVGFPGVVNSADCEILSTLGKFDDVPADRLQAWSEREFGLPIRIENDARLALLGEHFAGAGKGCSDLVMVTLGTGIGAGAMLRGALLNSRLGQAGAIGGHIPVQIGGRNCICGGIGCAEAEASTWALPSICAEWPGFEQSALAQEQSLNFAALFRAKDVGDRVATEVLTHCVAVWSTLSVSLINAYGPEVLLFGGGVMQRTEEILEPIRKHVATHSWRTRRGVAEVRASVLGKDAALIGAEALLCEGDR